MSEQETKQVSEDKIRKALDQLKNLAGESGEQVSKGHSSRGTATTEVESMRDGSVGAGSDQGSTQVYHTPDNSDPSGWAGSQARPAPDDGATDAIQEDGTDYTGGAEMVKGILHKLAKGQPLTAQEAQVYSQIAKGEYGMSKAESTKEVNRGAVKDEEYEEDDDAQKKDDTKKSLSDYAHQNDEVRKGFEMSQFLSNWADVQHQSLTATEKRLQNTVKKSLGQMQEEQKQFNGELAKSINNLAEVLSLQEQRINQLESTPARGPKSAQSVQQVEKSFGPGGQQAAGQEELTKSQVLQTMTDMVQKGELSATEVIKFESGSEISEDTMQKVRAHRNGR